MVKEIKCYQLKNIILKRYKSSYKDINNKDINNINIPYLKNINNLKISDRWKIQLTIAIHFISAKDERVMHSKNDNIEIMINNEADEVTKELFYSLKNRYQNNLESMKGSER